MSDIANPFLPGPGVLLSMSTCAVIGEVVARELRATGASYDTDAVMDRALKGVGQPTSEAVRPATARASPWLTAAEAAEYLRCPLSRVRKLTMQRALSPQRDGSRVLYRVDDLDRFVMTGGATT